MRGGARILMMPAEMNGAFLMRWSAKQVRIRAERTWELLQMHGLVLDTDVMRFEEGSKLYGINYKLAYSPQGETGHYELPALPAMGLLGLTAREAGEKLEAVNRALCDTLPRRKRDVMGLRIP